MTRCAEVVDLILSVRPTGWKVETIAAGAGIEVAEVEKFLAGAQRP